MKRQYIGVTIVILVCICMAMMPFIYLYFITGQLLPSILPEIQSDSLYYLLQIKEVLAGRWLLGNPYFIEYGDLRSPSILMPIWIASIPGLLGLPINTVFTVNVFIYTILTGCLFYILLLRYTNDHKPLTITLSILGTAYVHNLIVRPAVMQTVYPAFLIFLITFLLYLEQPNNRKKILGVAAATAFGFYMYLYVWMAAFTMLGLVLLWSIVRRQYPLLRSLLTVLGTTAILCLPQLVLMIKDQNSALLADLTYRTGLIESHLVQPLTVLNLKYVILTVIMLLLLYRKKTMPKSTVVVLLVSIALIISAMSNLITGIVLDLATLPWRLSLAVTPMAIACFILIAWKEPQRKWWERFAASCSALLLLATIVNHTFIRANSFPYLRYRGANAAVHKSIQEYKSVLNFLNAMVPNRQVILAIGGISSYIPLYTNHTLLFHETGRFSLIPTAEYQDRYFTQYVNYIDREFLRTHILSYVGNGPMKEEEYANACDTVPFCIPDGISSPLERIGGESFIEEIIKLHEDISNNYEKWLKKFSVSLIIIDREQEYFPRIPKSAVLIYDNGRMNIWQLKAE